MIPQFQIPFSSSQVRVSEWVSMCVWNKFKYLQVFI